MAGITQAELEAAVEQQEGGAPATRHAWDDLASSIIGKKLDSTVGKIDYDYENNRVKFQPHGTNFTDLKNVVGFNLQKPHAARADSTLNLHIHWEQARVSGTSVHPIFQYRYRVQPNGEEVVTAWTTGSTTSSEANNAFDDATTDITINQITKLVSIDWSDAYLSSTVQIQLTRGDDGLADIYATFIDGHVDYDQDGSIEEYVKWES